MKTIQHSSHTRPLITQAEKNSSLWIGHLQTDPTDHLAGQTFICPSEGLLDNIQIYSAAVQYPGELKLSLHEFDSSSKKWGPTLADSVMMIEKSDAARWIRFGLPVIALHQGANYGFRLQADNALIAIGEAAAGNTQPFTGHEWSADSKDHKGHFFSYFSLAFKIELCA